MSTSRWFSRVFCLFVVTALLVIPAAAELAMRQYDDTDFRGGDYRHGSMLSNDPPQTCADWCLQDNNCLGATYVERTATETPVCWLKDKSWQQQANPVTTSFLKVDVQVLEQTDLKGADTYKVDWKADMTPEWCSEYCLSKAQCVAATYVNPGTFQGPNPVCWLKGAGYDQYRNPQTTSFKLVALSASGGNPTGGGSWESCSPSFEATPLSGPVGVTVSFTDTTPGSRSWNWDFNNDGNIDSYVQNPTNVYNKAGIYSVALTVGCTLNINSVTKPDYISVGDGSLAVSSSPSGATIYVDEVSRGVTPNTITLAPKEYTLRVSKVGYADYSDSVTVIAAQTIPVSVTLVSQAPTTGSLSLTSNPSGAAITMDGGSQGMTPKVITGLAAGTHSLVFSMTGYLDHTATVDVQGGDTATYHAVLQKEGTSSQGGGSISVTSVPSGASVSLDGVAKGVTPRTITGVSPGSHALALSLPGYETYRVNVNVASGDTASFAANLVKSGTAGGVTGRVTSQVTETYPTYHARSTMDDVDDWDDTQDNPGIPGFAGIGALTALAVAILLVARKPPG
jgi:PKD repeat protein